MTSFASVTVSRIAVPDCCGWRFSCPDCRRDWFLFDWPESRGYDVIGTDWTRGQASGVIASLPPSPRQLRALKANGYDVTAEWTRQQANQALDDAAKRMETALARIRRAGFEITATGRRLTVHPEHRLSAVQRDWITARQAAIIAHMSAARP